MNSFKSEHRAPWECCFAKENRSECKPGLPPKSDQEYFEILCLCILQAGLSWKNVRKNWRKIRHGFLLFDISKLSKKSPDQLVKRKGVYKNERKVSAIIANAKKFLEIKQNFGSFQNFLTSLKKLTDEEAVKELTKTFKHVGKYTAEYYLHSIGYWES